LVITFGTIDTPNPEMETGAKDETHEIWVNHKLWLRDFDQKVEVR
jgi:hypothetical protein